MKCASARTLTHGGASPAKYAAVAISALDGSRCLRGKERALAGHERRLAGCLVTQPPARSNARMGRAAHCEMAPARVHVVRFVIRVGWQADVQTEGAIWTDREGPLRGG